MQHVIPSNGEMVMMYNLRSLIKDKLKKSIEEMKELIVSQGISAEEERVEYMFDIDEEFRGDFKLTAEAYANRMMMPRARRENSEHYGM